jgi:hypothetical protein
MARRKFLRSLIVKLDCGHEHEIATSFYRLTRTRAALICGERLACTECREGSIAKFVLRTERAERKASPQKVLFK